MFHPGAVTSQYHIQIDNGGPFPPTKEEKKLKVRYDKMKILMVSQNVYLLCHN